MPNILTLVVANPDQLLNASAYGAGAVIQVQSASAEAGPFADDGTTALVSGTTIYTYYDADGTSTAWYRTRYENAAGNVASDWSTPFQPDQSTALATYVSLTDLKLRLGMMSSTANDALLDQICDETNQWIETYVGRVLGPVSSATYTFDGGGPENPDRYTLDLTRLGIRDVTLLETATTTGGSFSTVSSSNYYVRPQNRPNGEPATHIHLYNASFYEGFGTIRVTMTAGFAAVPDDVRAVAIGIATRAWRGRETGMADVVGNDLTGSPIVTKIVPPEFKQTLERYQPVLVR